MIHLLINNKDFQGIAAGQLIAFKGGGYHTQIIAPSVIKRTKPFSTSSLLVSSFLGNSGLIFFSL
jgi:hypothetical protein